VAPADEAAPLNLGFLTVLHETNGYLGGYLVTNIWGRPLEFRLSTAVQPNRIQQILYGDTLERYLCADLIGGALLDKATTEVQLVLTDREPVLDLRLRSDLPVIWLPSAADARGAQLTQTGCTVRPSGGGRGPVLCHPQFRADVPVVRDMLHRLDPAFDLTEPFARIREAISEARKIGVTGRAA
jgi:hypothetical protein